MKKNELLEKDIEERLDNVRYQKEESEPNKQSKFYVIVVVLVTLSVVFSLLRYLKF